MSIKTYRGKTPSDALAQVKRDLGRGAVILRTRTYRVGGVMGFGGRQITEITATTQGGGGADRAAPARSNGVRGGGGARGGAEAVDRLLERAGLARDRVSLGERPAAGGVIAPPVEKDELEVGAVATPEPEAAPVAATVSPGPAAREVARSIVSGTRAGDGSMERELESLRRMVGQVLQASRGSRQPALPEALFDCYLRLMESEVASELADEIVGSVRDALTTQELTNPEVVRRAVLKRLAGHIPACGSAEAPAGTGDGRPRTIALVGPTGVGKTTTVAKLAATYKLRHGKKVGLITCDTYRIAAVEQLRTYANIIGLSLHVVLTPQEMADACRSLSDCDVILIDTAGRSQRDTSRLDELQRLLRSADPHETHLVLSTAASESVLSEAVARFASLDPGHVIFTKLDEAVSVGVIVNVARRIDARLSYVTMGQEVPDHIEPGDADRLASMVLREGEAT